MIMVIVYYSLYFLVYLIRLQIAEKENWGVTFLLFQGPAGLNIEAAGLFTA